MLVEINNLQDRFFVPLGTKCIFFLPTWRTYGTLGRRISPFSTNILFLTEHFVAYKGYDEQQIMNVNFKIVFLILDTPAVRLRAESSAHALMKKSLE
jgi:hypothetical protein